MAGRGTGAVSLVGGAVLAGAGGGLGLPHVAKTGLTPAAVAGLLGLAVGVVLVGYGTWVLAAGVPRWWRLAVVPACLLVAAVVVDVVALPVALTDVARTAVGTRAPHVAGVSVEDAVMTTRDGVRLSGWYLPSRNRAAVVLLHGSGSTRSSTTAQAQVLSRNGFGVLMLDARGHGRSAGRAMDLGWLGDADVGAAVTYLASRPDVDPHRIALVGLSMGGEEAIGAAAADARVRAVVAEGVTGRQAADLHWLSDEYGWRGAAQEGIEAAHTRLAALLSGQSPPVTLRHAVARLAPRPLLLIAAGEVPDEQLAAADLRSVAPSTVTVWRVPGSGHTQGLRTAPGDWERTVVGFLRSATGSPPA